MLDGAWDLRGHLDPETGTLLARELERRLKRATSSPEVGSSADEPDDEPADDQDPRLAAFDAALTATPDPHAHVPPLLVSNGQRRHDALTQLLRDATDTDPGTVRPPPTALTVTATIEALEGVSGTHRNATRKERAALRARWGPWCAITGCTRTATVPHHVRPWWLTHRTTLRDLVPICEHDHRDLHEHHRTLRLEDGRLVDGLGWVDGASQVGRRDAVPRGRQAPRRSRTTPARRPVVTTV